MMDGHANKNHGPCEDSHPLLFPGVNVGASRGIGKFWFGSEDSEQWRDCDKLFLAY
jgi:hypothetical protein